MTKIRESNILGTLVTELKDVSSDTTPQLGGDLDLNSSNITGTGDINITGSITATSFSGTLNNVVEDTTPQLGGDLDTNGNNILIDNGNFIGDENGLEQIKFATTASAVNEFQVTNASTGNAPVLEATGGDTNIDLSIQAKGIGRVTLNAAKVQQIAEKTTIDTGAGLSSTFNFDVITQAVRLHTGDNAGNWTLNIRGDSSNSLDSIMDVGESITIALISKNGGTPYYNSAVQIDGSSVTPEWQGGAAPTAGNANSNDIYSYTIIKTGSATFSVFASQTQFA